MKWEITKEEFIISYCNNSKVDRKWLMERQKAIPCDCDYEECKWWQMINNNNN